MDTICLQKGQQILRFRSDLILAPLDGYGDVPFRLLCQDFGSGANYIPFIGAEELLSTSPRLHKRVDFDERERPVLMQLVGNHEDRLVMAALRAQELGVDAVDLNLGCSAKGVSSRGAGAGLLRDPEKVARITQAIAANLHLPLTAKIRLGWDEDSLNYTLIARILEDNGAQMIAVHARTRKQAYKGEADWDAIAEIKQQVSVPVIGNGDVAVSTDIPRLFEHTGCDAVMIGRAAVDNPWIFQHRDRWQIDSHELLQTIHHHADMICSFYGEARGLMLLRKYLKRYLAPLSISRKAMLPLLTCSDRESFDYLLKTVMEEVAPDAARPPQTPKV